MGDATIFKTVDEYSVQSFNAYKTWTFTESTITQYSSSVNEALYLSSSVIIDPNGVNASGLSKSSLFAAVYNSYYKYGWKPFNALGGNAQFQFRDISQRSIVVSIGNDYIGDGIKPGSVSILDSGTGSISILDDGFGNLYDSAVTNLVPSTSLVGQWTFNDGFITSGNLVGAFENRNGLIGHTPLRAYNVTYTPGRNGSLINFNGGVSSFAIGDNETEFNFRSNEDFAVSLWVKIPTTQVYTTTPDNYIVSKWDGEGGYPFAIRMFNQTHATVGDRGKVYVASWDGIQGVGISSTSALNDNAYHHILYKKSSSAYELFVDGTSNGSVTPTTPLGQTHNNAPLVVGAGAVKIGTDSWTGTIPFTGAVEELRIFSGSMTSAQVSALYSNPSNTNIVGNVFYSHGIIVLTNLSGSYLNLMCSGSKFVMNYKSTVTINESNVMLTVTPSEYNMTFNPSSANVISNRVMEYLQFVTGSDWSPYITTIGLYDKDYNLVALGKLAKPIKKSMDMPMTFAIRWDS